jgi:arylsulfatase A-like enzyme
MVDLAYTMGAYDDGVLYTDELISVLVDKLTSMSSERDILMVVTSDHGDEFLEHGGLGHGTTLYPELLQTFAIFWRPNHQLQRTPFTSQATTVDIAPTLLELLHIEPPEAMRGASLLSGVTNQAAVSELANHKVAINNGWGVIRNTETGEDEVVSYVDKPNAPASPQLLEELTATLDALRVRATTDGGMELNSELTEELKALGYIE